MAKSRRPVCAFVALAAFGGWTFVGPSPATPRTAPRPALATAAPAVDDAWTALKETPLRRASDGKEVALTSLWQENEKVRGGVGCVMRVVSGCLKIVELCSPLIFTTCDLRDIHLRMVFDRFDFMRGSITAHIMHSLFRYL